MKKNYFFLIALSILVLLPLVLIVITPTEYKIERIVSIEKPANEVFDFIKYLKNQDKYSVWAQMDPDAKVNFIGKDASKGFIVQWDSEVEEVGKGEQEIIAISPGRIDLELRFFEPFEAISPAYMVTEPSGETSTTVKWGLSGEIPRPFNLMLMGDGFENELGSQLQTGLDNLKKILE